MTPVTWAGVIAACGTRAAVSWRLSGRRRTGAGGVGHGYFSVRDRDLVANPYLLCTKYATMYACRLSRGHRAADEAGSRLTTWSPPPSTSSTEKGSTR